MAVSEGIKKIVGFLTQGFEGRGDDVFEEMAMEMDEYPTRDNLALEPNYAYTPARHQDSKVVAHPNFRGYEVMVCEPRSYEDSIQIVKHLKEKRTIILNLHLLDKEQSLRIVDFLCGATHALVGNQQKIGDSVFIFTPSNVSLSAESQKNKVIRDALWSQPQI